MEINDDANSNFIKLKNKSGKKRRPNPLLGIKNMTYMRRPTQICDLFSCFFALIVWAKSMQFYGMDVNTG